MKPTIFEIYGTQADTGEQVTLTKLIFGDITVEKLFDKWRRKGIKVHYVRIVKELDLPPDELLFYINEMKEDV